MPGLLPDVDPDGLLEYSVVYTDRSVNHMSRAFRDAMVDISSTLRAVYRAEALAIVPGGGTFGMEAVARQFATGRRCLVIRNGWFSYRWSQIFDTGRIPSACTVLTARPVAGSGRAFAPVPLADAQAAIATDRPELVFAPHVETASGMLLPDDYVRGLARAVHDNGGLLVIDAIASGALWLDMRALGVDILISAPQKGWSGTPCCAFVLLGSDAAERLQATTSTSFACDVRRWRDIMRAYEDGGHAYHATMPTDGLMRFRDVMDEARAFGFDALCAAQRQLGEGARALLASHGFDSVAAPGFEAPGVIVCYTDDPTIRSGAKFAEHGLQIAAGVPLQCGEPDDFRTFRIGLFGLDKLRDIDRTLAHLERALTAMA